ALREGGIHLLFRVERNEQPPAGESPVPAFSCEVRHLEGSVTGSEALALAQSRLTAGNLRAFQAEVRRRTGRVLPPPLRVWSQPVIQERKAFSLAALVPLILVLMTITGAVYPAIDLTAGERERGTLEVLMAAPVPRVRLLLAKYVAVYFVAVLTALLN